MIIMVLTPAAIDHFGDIFIERSDCTLVEKD